MSRTLSMGLGIVALLAGARVGRAATSTISIPDVTGPPGSSQELCVYLNSNGNQVAGMQMDLVWDANCLTVVMADADSAACQKNPGINKETFRTKVAPSANSMRVIFLSISDLSPMPDGQQFCCAFDIAASAAGRQCALMMNHVILSTPVGAKADAQAQPGRVIVTDTGSGGGGQGGPQPVAPRAPPVVSAPGGNAPGPGTVNGPGGGGGGGGVPAPVGKAPPGGMPAAPIPGRPSGEQQPQAAGEAPAAEATPQGSPVVTAAPAAGLTGTPQRTPAAVKTPTPHAQGTKTISPASTPAAATTPTPHAKAKAKGKAKKKRTATPAAP